jgi:hypothetical protein
MVVEAITKVGGMPLGCEGYGHYAFITKNATAGEVLHALV